MAVAGGVYYYLMGSESVALGDHKSMPAPVVALVFGLASALSLPVGALLGIAMSPVNPYIVANIIAFGAGCLMFAVTVELYGDQLMHLQLSDYHATEEIIICLASAFIGAILYILLNRWVEGMEDEGEGSETAHEGETRVITKGIEHTGHADPEKGEHKPLLGDKDKKEDKKETPRSSARGHWAKVRTVVKFHKLKFNVKLRHGTAKGEGNAKSLALGMLAGIIADGIPESVLIGLLASEGHLSMMFVCSLFIANFPESFSSASLMIENNVFPWYQIVGLWTVPFVATGGIAGLACWAIPPWAHATMTVRIIAAVIEGLAGGMMLAMIASVMLPQAFNMAKENPVWHPWAAKDAKPDEHHGGDIPGVLCVCGFLVAVGLKVLGGAMGSAH